MSTYDQSYDFRLDRARRVRLEGAADPAGGTISITVTGPTGEAYTFVAFGDADEVAFAESVRLEAGTYTVTIEVEGTYDSITEANWQSPAMDFALGLTPPSGEGLLDGESSLATESWSFETPAPVRADLGEVYWSRIKALYQE